MKANIANYLIQDLSSRFPIRNEDAIHADLIDAVIDDWANDRFFATGNSVKFHQDKNSSQPYLM